MAVGVGLLVLVGAAVATGVALAYPDDLVLWISAGAGIILGVALVSGWSCAPSLWLAARRNRRFYEWPTEIEADGRGVRMTNGAFVSAAPWSMFKRLRENDAYFFLDNGVGAAILVPKRAFDSVDAVRFRALAAAGVGHASAPDAAMGDIVPMTGGVVGEPDGDAAGAVVRGAFTMTVGEYGRATSWLLRHNPSSWIVAIGLALFGVAALVVLGALEDWLITAWAVGMMLFGIALATGLIARPILWLAGRRRRELFTQPTTVIATAAGIRVTSPLYDNVLAWDAFERIRASREHLYLEAGGGQTVFLPLRAFAPRDLQRLEELAGAARSPR